LQAGKVVRMNFLLIVPKYKAYSLFYDFPLGLAYISAAMKKEGLNVSCLNLNHYLHVDQAETIAKIMVANRIDVVCTGGLITHYNIINDLLQQVRRIKSNVITIVGGGLITCEPELIFDNLDVDYGVLGEGDLTIGELARAIIDGREPGDVKGIIYRKPDGQVMKTEARKPIDDISALAWPDYQGLGIEYYLDNQLPYDSSIMQIFDEPRVLPVISSRSCPYRCSFCYHPLGNKYRSRELDDFFSEIERLINQYDVNGLLIVDELLCHNKERLAEFCRRIKPFHTRWMAQLRVDSVNKDMLKMLKDSGCYLISYGIESAHDEILRSMKKHTTVAQVEKAIELTYDAGISAQGNLLFSDRSETIETAMESVEWALRHWYHRFQLAPLFALPRSSDYLYAVETGLVKDKMEYIRGGCRFVNISRMNKEEMDSILGILMNTSFCLLLVPEEYEVTETGYDLKRNAPLYELSVKCPHCERFVHYRNICHYENMINNRFLHCKYCHGRFDIMLEWFDHFQEATVNSDQDFLAYVREKREAAAKGIESLRARVMMKAAKKPDNPYYTITMDAEEGCKTGRKFAVLLPLDNMHRKVAVNIGQALAEQGGEACVLEIPGITEQLLKKCDRGLLESFYLREGITDTVSINACRDDLNVPGSIRHHGLMQGGEQFVASNEGKDFAYVTFMPKDVSVATNYNRFYREPGREDSYEAEIGVTFDYLPDRPSLRPEIIAVLNPFLNAVKKQIVSSQDYTLSIAHADELLDRAEKQLGQKLQGPRERLIDYITTDFIQSVMKSELLRRLRYVAKKHDWRLKIAGRYWEQVPAWAEYSGGFVGYGESMARFLQSCAAVIHLHGKNNVQLLDVMGCGAFCIAREHPEENVRRTMAKCFPDNVLCRYENDKELDKILAYYIEEHPEERLELAQAGSEVVRERFTYDSLAKRMMVPEDE